GARAPRARDNRWCPQDVCAAIEVHFGRGVLALCLSAEQVLSGDEEMVDIGGPPPAASTTVAAAAAASPAAATSPAAPQDADMD
ncbi:MAG: hypothetical protein EBU46_16590, partial [Nitrosomonadaceae bacterium]|nr:hypothetical protein [Nitrosomonadaceae bacterium]